MSRPVVYMYCAALLDILYLSGGLRIARAIFSLTLIQIHFRQTYFFLLPNNNIDVVAA